MKIDVVMPEWCSNSNLLKQLMIDIFNDPTIGVDAAASDSEVGSRYKTVTSKVAQAYRDLENAILSDLDMDMTVEPALKSAGEIIRWITDARKHLHDEPILANELERVRASLDLINAEFRDLLYANTVEHGKREIWAERYIVTCADPVDLYGWQPDSMEFRFKSFAEGYMKSKNEQPPRHGRKKKLFRLFKFSEKTGKFELES